MSSFSRCWTARGFALAASIVLAGIPALRSAPQLVPGVYGYGADRAINPAGFGSTSTIIEVTNLNDSGAGSLRAAILASGSRVVVFRTSGVINLASNLNIANGNITIAGQTAPSPGISIHNGSINVQANNVLVQHLRIRPGDRWTNISTQNRDAVSVANNGVVVSDVVFDHCTFTWSLDEMASTWYDWDNVTFNKCIFAEPLHASNHLDEGTFSPNTPKQVELLTNTKSTSFTTSNTTSSHAIGGTYQLVNTTADTQWIEYTVPIVSSSSTRGQKHLNIVGIKGTDRARFRTELRNPSNVIIPNSSEVFDLYGSAAQATYVTYQNMTQSFTIPANISSIKVRLIVAGRHASSTGWKLGIDQISITDGHGLGPLFSSGESGAGKLTLTGSIIAHLASRGPWSNAKHFYFANNVMYNRSWTFLHFGHSNWSDAIHAAVLGNTFIEGKDMSASGSIPSPISDTATPSTSQLYIPSAQNTYNYGDRASPPPMIDSFPSGTLVGSDPTVKTAGLAGVTALTPANAYAAALLGAGARPADRDAQELRLVDEIADGAGITALASRPGAIKHTVAQAGGWPTYAANTVAHSYPSSPNGDTDGDGYTNIEEWLHQKAAEVEGNTAVLVGRWQLNEGSGTSTADSSGNSNNGTLSPAPAWTSGISGAALNFDGVDDAVSVGSPALLDDLSAITVAAWIKTDTTGEAGLGRIVAKSSGTSPVNGWHFCLSGANAIGFAVDYSTTNLNVISANNVFTTGNWHHVAATWNGSTAASNVTLYVDGVEVASYATATSANGTRASDASSSLFIGNESTGARTFDGAIDDVRVYHGVLSQSDIAALGATGAPSGLNATPTSYNQINLSWTDNGSTETGFKIERKKGAGGAFTQIDTVGANVTSYSDTTCGAGTQYYYRVRAYNGSGDTPYSNEANATTSEITSGRQAHWKFDENTGTSTADASGNSNTGTLANGAAWVAGKIGTAIDFDAVDNVVNVGSGASIDDLAAITITAWIKADSIGEGGNPGRILHKGTGTSATNGWQFVVQGTNCIAFAVDHATTDLNRVSAQNAFTNGVWTHVAVTWTGSATATNVKLYIDGAETGSYTTTTNAVGARTTDAASSAFVGNNSTGARTFDGAIDDVRVYNRVISAAELTAIHRAGL